jgi:hypothetical protein
MGLLPLGAWGFATILIGERGQMAPRATPELLFFALSTFSTALLNLSRGPHARLSPGWALGLIFTIVSAVLYGEVLFGEALHAAMQAQFGYNVCIGLMVVAVVYGAIAEAITHRRAA